MTERCTILVLVNFEDGSETEFDYSGGDLIPITDVGSVVNHIMALKSQDAAVKPSSFMFTIVPEVRHDKG